MGLRRKLQLILQTLLNKQHNHIIISDFIRSYSPIGRFLRWRIGESSPDRAGTGEIKYPGRTKGASAALQEDIDLSKGRER